MSYHKYKQDPIGFSQDLKKAYKADEIRMLAKSLGCISWNDTKALNIDWLCSLFSSTLKVEQDHLAQVLIIQRWWRRRQKPVFRGPWPLVESVNTEDVFTLEPLTAFPQKYIFSYIDPYDKSVYAFCAPELHYAIRVSGNFNPYTRKPIPDNDVKRLNAIMKYLPHKRVPRFEHTWTSVQQAYGHVLAVLEREFGIYCHSEWMLKWTRRSIVRIFYQFHQNIPFHTHHFDLDALIDGNERNVKYILAKEILRLCEDTSDPHQMYLICNMLFTFANNSASFRRNLPPWVLQGAVSI